VPEWQAVAVGRFALAAFGLFLIACGSHVESGSASVDPLLAFEKDPQAALTAAKHPPYKAPYELTFSSLYASAAPGGASLSSTQTYVARPPDFRWDFTVTVPVQFRMVAIFRDNGAYLCLDQDTTPGCYVVPVTYTQQMLLSLNESPLDMLLTSAKDMDVTVLPRERIAGLDAACFRWRPRVTASATASPSGLLGQLGDLKLEGCFSADGVMLRTLTSSGSLFAAEQRATSVSGTVTDADFALPYPVTSAPFPIPTSAPLPPQTPRPTPTRNPNPTR